MNIRCQRNLFSCLLDHFNCTNFWVITSIYWYCKTIIFFLLFYSWHTTCWVIWMFMKTSISAQNGLNILMIEMDWEYKWSEVCLSELKCFNSRLRSQITDTHIYCANKQTIACSIAAWITYCYLENKWDTPSYINRIRCQVFMWSVSLDTWANRETSDVVNIVCVCVCVRWTNRAALCFVPQIDQYHHSLNVCLHKQQLQ